jgi:hypothetical protein
MLVQVINECISLGTTLHLQSNKTAIPIPQRNNHPSSLNGVPVPTTAPLLGVTLVNVTCGPITVVVVPERADVEVIVAAKLLGRESVNVVVQVVVLKIADGAGGTGKKGIVIVGGA